MFGWIVEGLPIQGKGLVGGRQPDRIRRVCQIFSLGVSWCALLWTDGRSMASQREQIVIPRSSHPAVSLGFEYVSCESVVLGDRSLGSGISLWAALSLEVIHRTTTTTIIFPFFKI